MSKQIQGGRLLTLLIARDQRKNLRELERELERLTKIVDDFYDRLGPRNWVFHERLDVAQVEALLAETSDAESAERRLIEIYQDTETTRWWLTAIRSQDGLRERFHQIERAKQHYGAGQFSSCVFHLIAVMDGFVNDFEPAVRKGLASRDPDDMTAWDSVVGHHLGLTNVMRTFRRTIKKRIDEEVFELYRHGIMHGSVVSFDNVIVATKAWNMLFAVADWATATVKASRTQKPEPSWREVWSKLKRHVAHDRFEKAFVATTVRPVDSVFDNDEVVTRAGALLEAWQHGRWGLVASFTPPVLLDENASEGEAARFAKEVFGQYRLAAWEITEVAHDQVSSAEVRAAASVNDDEVFMQFRMVRWAADGTPALLTDDGTWRLAVWAPHTFFA